MYYIKTVKVDDLKPGEKAPINYFSHSGELLIPIDSLITENHIRILKNRFDKNLYKQSDTPPEKEDNEVLFSRKNEIPKVDIKNLQEEYKNIEFGEKGFDELMSRKSVREVDSSIAKGALSITAFGGLDIDSLAQKSISDRDVKYKKEVSNNYSSALTDIHTVIKMIAQHKKGDAGELREIVGGFFKHFITDRNILLNLTHNKPTNEDEYIYFHSLNVSLLSINLAAFLGFNKSQILDIGIISLINDLGMLLVPDEIRFKDGKLTPDEIFEVRKHPITGLELAEKIAKLPQTSKFVIYQTHEAENGTGYPKGRKSRFIHPFAKIIKIADIYDALTSDKPHRPKLNPYKAMETMLKMASHDEISREYFGHFLHYCAMFPVGSVIKLSDGRLAKVVEPNGKYYTKPTVSVIVDENGKTIPETEKYSVNLLNDSSVSVTECFAFSDLKNISLMTGF